MQPDGDVVIGDRDGVWNLWRVDADGEHAVSSGPDEVGGQQIGSELQSLETRVDGFGKARNRGRFRQPRDPFDQKMPPGQQTNQHSMDKLGLANQDAITCTEIVKVSGTAFG